MWSGGGVGGGKFFYFWGVPLAKQPNFGLFLTLNMAATPHCVQREVICCMFPTECSLGSEMRGNV